MQADFPSLAASKVEQRARKSALGQFMTPRSVARFMASLFPPSSHPTCRLLDAGAGTGALSCAFLDRWTDGDFGFTGIEATTYEIDELLCRQLTRRLVGYDGVTSRIIEGDYIQRSTAEPLHGSGYTHAILNPPYKKIGSRSPQRLALRSLGIETVNLYSAFVALALMQSAPGGQIVAIVPRSFCNGPYYRPFRDFVLSHAALRHIHLFGSRSQAFKDDDVLQENVIIRLERGGRQGAVTVSTSTDGSFADLVTTEHPFSRIVLAEDSERFIHVPTLPDGPNTHSTVFQHSLADLGISVSTGPVVDFRLKAHLRDQPDSGTVPLLYPVHFNGGTTRWPRDGIKKPNAIQRNTETEKWLYPNGHYCVVRRFSSKEERRRVVASVVDPVSFGAVSVLGFENHLNLFHENKRGLPPALAHGLTLFLNTTAVDDSFRRFSGHTQVNATDLRQLKYPSRTTLTELGDWAMQQGKLTQVQIDEKIGSLGA